MKLLTIGKVAEQTGLGIETIRFYERKGLIATPPRPSTGYRHYPEEIVERLHFIKRAKKLGFSLKEIGELIALRIDPGSTCAQVKLRTEEKIAAIEDRIVGLERMRRALQLLANSCAEAGPNDDCPVLESLDGETER